MDAVVFWILALPTVALLYFTHGLIEECTRKRRTPAEPSEAKPSIERRSKSETPVRFDWPQAAHGYDMPELFREDALRHIGENDRAVAEHERNIQAILAEMKQRERGD